MVAKVGNRIIWLVGLVWSVVCRSQESRGELERGCWLGVGCLKFQWDRKLCLIITRTRV